MTNHGYFVIYLIPIPFTIIANIGLYKILPFEGPTHIIENYHCPDCIAMKKRCPMCKDHIKCGLHLAVEMNDEQMEKAYNQVEE